MSITAKKLNGNSLKNKDLDLMIKEQLQIIDDKILRSDKGIGKNFITHSLPTNVINIIGYEKADIQRVMYSSILCSLEQRGFKVRIMMEKDLTILYIEWIVEIENILLDRMNSILGEKRIDRDELIRITKS